MGLCYQTTRWLDRLWAEHLELSEPARQLVIPGPEPEFVKKHEGPREGPNRSS